jgi:acyl-CoA synthetase (AMP-forming)/AMP-acid ligase II
LDQLSNQTAHLFRNWQLQVCDGIAILLDNDLHYMTICWAAQRSGLYYTPISTLFQNREINYILNNSDAKLLITKQTILDRIQLQLPSQLKVITLDPGRYAHWQTEIKGLSTDPVADEVEGSEMVYSSGTTGKPKGVRFDLAMNPPGTVTELTKKRIQLHQVDDTVRYLSTAPLYHSAPLRYNLMVSRLGGTSIIMEKFSAEDALRLIQEEKITHSQWVPTMFVRLLALPDAIRYSFETSSLRFAIHAAAPCPIHIKEKMINWWGPILYEYYSGTEANGSTAINSAEWLAHKGSVGKPIHGELRILDDEGSIVPVGQVGVVYFANGTDFNYFKDPEKTTKAKNRHGWSTLGDMGYVDSDGYLYLKDRKSFMIISGGVNIYPQEIEDVLLSHAQVMDAAVFGIPNAEYGEEVKAVVQPVHQNYQPCTLEQELIAYCRENLSHLKCPKSISFMTDLPRHPNGKLYKAELKAPYWENHTSNIL